MIEIFTCNGSIGIASESGQVVAYTIQSRAENSNVKIVF